MTKPGKRRKCALWTATALWMCLCLYLSWQPGDETTALSGEIAQTVRRVIRLFGIEVDITELHMALRKLAHPAVFCVAGVLSCCAVGTSLPQSADRNTRSFAISIAACAALAVIAEVGKLWVPGRHLQWDETLLDITGAAVGAAVVWFVKWLRRS